MQRSSNRLDNKGNNLLQQAAKNIVIGKRI